MPAHLADWLLTREMYEQVPGTPGLYRLTNQDEDGRRRARQAVLDLRKHGYAVQADFSPDPALTSGLAQPTLRNGLMERRNRIAQAATARSPQRGPVLATLPGTRPIPPRPAYPPTAGTPQSAGHGRGR